MDSSSTIDIALTGDFCPTGRTEDLCLTNKYKNIYGDILPILQNSDLSITNLECPLTDHLAPIGKLGPALLASPKCIEILQLGRIGVVTLANNHIMDQGVQGLQDTMRECDVAGIKTVGAGENLEAAAEPLYVDVKGTAVALISCAETEFSIAGSQKPGANPLDPVRIHHSIRKAKSHTDTILVVVHGGNEFYQYPSPRMVDTYRFIADMGVTAVIGHHTHCASGYECRNGVPIIYSLGNFLFDRQRAVPKGWNEGIIAGLKISDSKVTDLTISPFYQCRDVVELKLMTGSDKKEFLGKLDKISGVIDDREELEKNWNGFLNKKEMEYMPHLLAMNKYERYLFRRGLDLFKRAGRKQLLYLLNFMQCEAHRDVATALLRKWIEKGR